MQQRLFYFMVIFLAGISISCEKDKTKNDILTIVCTTGMIGDMVGQIVKDKAKVINLMGPGVDPHLYKATHGDLVKLQNADYIIYNGLHLEGKLGEIFNKLSKIKPIYSVGGAIPHSELLDSIIGGTTLDPHIWFDVNLWSKATDLCGEWLSNQDKKNGKLYLENTKLYIKKLQKLDKDIFLMIDEIPEKQRILITAHDAFSYFGRRYGMEVKGLQGISTQSEFGIKDVNNIVNFIIERNIKSIFVESSVSKKSIEAIIENTKSKGKIVKIGGVLFSDAMGKKGTSEGTYIGMVRHNVNVIVKSLK